MRLLRHLHRAALLPMLSLLIGAGTLGAAVTMDENGWTIVTPSADSRIIYVSSSEGNNANDGLSPETPKATITAGDQLVRNGYPDHLLLKRGDTFTTDNALGRWKNGRSQQEPILVSGYGEGPRPIVHVDSRFIQHSAQPRQYQAVIGIDLYRPISDPDSPLYDGTESTTAISFVGGGADLLVEDCRFRFVGLVIQSFNGDQYSNFVLRRNIFTDNWLHDSYTEKNHTSGIYVSGVDGYLIEENFFDHCGWNEEIEGAGANMYAHNVYIQYDNTAGSVFRGNISARSAAHGAHMRSGGIAERNLFVLNSIGANFGGVSSPTDPAVLDYPNLFRQNAILSGRLMDPTNSSWPRTPAVWGFIVAYVGEVDVFDNIIANRRDDGQNQAFGTVEEPASLNQDGNIVYKWRESEDMADPSWPSPDASLGDYYDSIVGTDAEGEAATIEYLEWLRERPQGVMPWEMTAYAALSYIRAGFNKEPVGGYYKYDSESPVRATGIVISGEDITMDRGESVILLASVQPADAHNQGIIWESADASVASIDDYGHLVATGGGSTTITATTKDGSFSDTITVDVDVVEPTSITISPKDSGLILGESNGLTALIGPENGDSRLTWSSSDSEVVSVDEDGIVTAHAVGEAVITATTVAGGLVDTARVTVTDPELLTENLALNKSVTVTEESGAETGDRIVDGSRTWNVRDRWAASGFPQSATVDLGESQPVAEFWIFPQHNRAYEYVVEVSSDQESWSQIVDRTLNHQGGAVLINRVEPVEAQYVRLTVTGVEGYIADSIGIGEFEIYGPADEPPLPDPWIAYDNLNGWVDAGGYYLGWLYVEQTPWIYSSSLDTWLYTNTEDASQGGLWAYSAEGWEPAYADFQPWLYHWSLQTWIYGPAEGADSPGWGYIVDSNP